MRSDESYECYEYIDEDDSDDGREMSEENVQSTASEQNVQPRTAKERPKRTQRTTLVQFQILLDFMNSHDKKTLGIDVFNKAWYKLVNELNEAGPPSHDSTQWKRIWIHYKCKNLKKVEQPSTSKTPKLVGASDPDNPLEHTSSPSVVEIHECSSSKRETLKVETLQLESKKEHQIASLSPKDENSVSNTFQMQVMEKLDVIIEQNQILNKNMDMVVVEGKRTNDLLEKLLEK